jgi:hypothetical protein
MTKAWKCVFASTAAALRGSFIVPTNSWLCGTPCRFMGPKRRLDPPDTKHGGFAPPSCRERRKKLSSGLIAQRRARIEANSCAMRVAIRQDSSQQDSSQQASSATKALRNQACITTASHASQTAPNRNNTRIAKRDGAMVEVPSDDEVARQILHVFVEYKVIAGGTLRRNHFSRVRDAYFQRGLTEAVDRGWIKRTRDRYKYELTEGGCAETRNSPGFAARA